MATGKQIRAYREIKEWTLDDLSRESGVDVGTISALEVRDSFRSKYFQPIASAFGLTVEQLSDGTTNWLDKSLARSRGREIKVLENAAEMGIGADQLSEDIVFTSICVAEEFFHKVGSATADKLRFIHAYGDSMSPTINSGDIVLVDTGAIEVKIDGIYVLEAHGRLFIKRVRQSLTGAFEVSSDNPVHKTVDVLTNGSSIEIKGRVLWYWNGRKVG